MSLLLDTNVVSELRRRVMDPAVRRWASSLDPDTLYLSVLTLGEIAQGIALVQRRDPATAAHLDHWLRGLPDFFADRLLPVTPDISMVWGRLSARRTLPVIDGLLAATATVHDLVLATRNERDFVDTGIAVVNPWKE